MHHSCPVLYRVSHGFERLHLHVHDVRGTAGRGRRRSTQWWRQQLRKSPGNIRRQDYLRYSASVPTPSNAPKRPPAVLVISAALVLEALGLLAFAGWYGYELATSTPLSMGGAVFTLIFAVALAVWLLAVGHFFFRGYRWTRSAAMVWQFFVVIIAVPTLQAGVVAAGLGMLLPAAAVLLLLFTKPVLAHTSRVGTKTL